MTFTPEKECVTVFRGAEVRYKVRSLKRKDAMALLPHLPQPDENGNVSVDLAQVGDMSSVIEKIMPDYITLIEAPDPLEVIIDEWFYNELFMGMTRSLIEHSFGQTEEDVKNSVAPSPVESVG